MNGWVCLVAVTMIGVIGNPRIWKALLKKGFQVVRKRVARLIAGNGVDCPSDTGDI